MLLAGTAPSLGSGLADDAPASPEAPTTDEIREARATLEPTLAEAEAEPTVADGFDLARAGLTVHADRLEATTPEATQASLADARTHLAEIETTLSLLEEPSTASQPTASPTAAVEDLADQVDADLSPDDRAELAQLDELPSPWPDQLSAWIQAFTAFHAETETALADVEIEGELPHKAAFVEDLRRQLDETEPGQIDNLDLEPEHASALTDAELADIQDARDDLFEASLALEDLARDQPLSGEPDVDACPVAAFGLANEDTTYTDHCRLMLDLGGADSYENNAGGAWTIQNGPTSCSISSGDDRTPGFRAAALVDVGSRDDTYGDVEDPLACGVNGGAAVGSGFLLDDGGSDYYVAGELHSYANAAVNTGTGTLIDLGAGDDVYDVARYGNGQVFVGTGLFYDEAGDDVYRSSHGYANGEGGGSGNALVDGGGDDRYLGADTSNGVGLIPGAGLLLDVGGTDVYEGTEAGTNGGGEFGGVGQLVDLGAGDDVYRATTTAVNGGGDFGGLGTLLDTGGDDIYVAEREGANGGASFGGQGLLADATGDDAYQALTGGVNGGASLGAGLLLDGDGHDEYQDNEGGTGTNKTVAPKGDVGAQVDVPHPPSAPADDGEDDEDPPTDPTSDARPHVLVGDSDTGINPYHEVYHRPDLTEHPCTYIPAYPSCDIPALNLTLDAPDLKTAIQQDMDVWESVEPGQWYWIPQTSIVAVACSADDDQCILSCSVDTLREEGRLSCATGSHGTHTSSTIQMENPDALLAFHEKTGSDIQQFRDKNLPIDIYSISYGHALPAPYPVEAGCPIDDTAPIYVTSSGNFGSTTSGAPTTLGDCWAGHPNNIAVGGAYSADRSEEGGYTRNPEVVSYYCRPAADDDSIDQYEEACGTSFSAPTVAGALSKVLLEVREATGYTGTVDDGVADPLYGDEGLSAHDLRDAMNRTATYDPEPRYDNTDTSGSIPLNPAAPFLQWGWGFYDGWIANATTDHLLEEEAEPRPDPVRAYMEAQHAVKTALYGNGI
jgi:hypothetical protein